MRRAEPAIALVAAACLSILPFRARAAMDPNSPGRPTGDARVTCGIDARESGGATTLQGVVRTQEKTAGRYTLRVRKSGPAGTSDVTQAGAFAAEPGLRLGLGTVSVNLERAARYDAVLTLTVEGATLECRTSGPTPSDL